MNDTQQIFCIFFAISWGLVGNVQPRWKPFNYAVASIFRPAFYRFFISTFFFNILPFFYFGLALWRLSFVENCLNHMIDYLNLVAQGFLPAFALFSFYHFWIAIIEKWPECFYGDKNTIPKDFQKKVPNGINIEPCIRQLNIIQEYWIWNIIIGVIYFSIAIIPLIFLEINILFLLLPLCIMFLFLFFSLIGRAKQGGTNSHENKQTP
jgi:hypothetical protein